jgi:hypothetical protein
MCAEQKIILDSNGFLGSCAYAATCSASWLLLLVLVLLLNMQPSGMC